MSEEIIERQIWDEMRVSYMTYAMSVIVSRALPDVRDGLKPVHRRILFAMHKLGLTHDKPFKKSAYVVGEVLGKYHPHGEGSIYDSLVRMAQDFALRRPLIEGHGNFGSVDGDPAAALRYTESRLHKVSAEMLKEIDRDTVDFKSNYDDSHKEPTVLPSAFPNLLVNGSAGIAVGMATNMPPHNTIEVVQAIIHQIDNPDCTISELTEIIKGPDFPTGGIVYGKEGLHNAYHIGRGVCKVRSQLDIEDLDGITAIVVTEIPYQINKSEMVKKIASYSREEIINGIAEIRDESGKEGIRIVLELKKTANPKTVINQLFKYSQLETSFGINNIAIVDGVPKSLHIKDIIFYFIAHRFEVKTRRIRYDLIKAKEKSHVLEGLMVAVANIDEVVKIIRASQSVEDAKKNLIHRFQFSTSQTQAILDTKLSRLVSLEIQKLQEDLDELKRLIVIYEAQLAAPEKIYQLIKEELEKIKNEFGNERKTKILGCDIEQEDDASLIPKTNCIITISRSGYIRRINPQEYRTQGKGGHGVKGVSSPSDLISILFSCTSHHYVMLFSNLGRAYWLRAFEIAESSRISRGSHIRSILQLESDETVQGYIVFEDFSTAGELLLATKRGIAKRCHATHFARAKKRGIQAINLVEQDSVVTCLPVQDDDTVLFCSQKGRGLKIVAQEFRVMGRTARGVRSMRIDPEKDSIIGVCKVSTHSDILLVTERGLGKRFRSADFAPHGRGTKGQLCIKVKKDTGDVVKVHEVTLEDDILITTSKGSIIRISSTDVRQLGRSAQGSRLVKVHEQDKVVDAAIIHPFDPAVD